MITLMEIIFVCYGFQGIIEEIRRKDLFSIIAFIGVVFILLPTMAILEYILIKNYTPIGNYLY